MKSFEIKNFQVYHLENSLIVFKPKKELQYAYEDSIVLNIARNTNNTWQKNRSFEETLDNTVQGKVVEEMFENYITAQGTGIKYTSYDVFRNDNYSKHAPFDGLLYRIDNPYVSEAIDKVTMDVNMNAYGKLSDKTFLWLTNHKVYTVEIKSSKIPDKDYPTKVNSKFNSWQYQYAIIDNLRKRDFFVYPKYNRTNGKTIHNFNDYVYYVKNNHVTFQGDFVTELLKQERKGKCDIYTRIFVDRNNSENLIAYILGYTLKDNFFNNTKIINMPGGKSGNAIYFAYPISKSNHIDELLEDKNLW